MGSGSSRMTATEAVRTVGVPQPISTIGPNRKRPSAVGKSVSSWPRICDALAMAFFGNMKLSLPAFFTAAPRVHSTEAERCTASRPPTPFSVKPQPN